MVISGIPENLSNQLLVLNAGILGGISKWDIYNRYYKRPKQLNSKICVICSKEFSTNHSKQICCSLICKKERTQQLYDKRKQDNYQTPEYRLRFSILARNGFRCRYCGATPQEDGVKLQVDHIIPESKGGGDNPENLITACQKCNVGKSDLLLLTKHGQIPSFLTIEFLSSEITI